ncbi:conserved Plasmodium protein, unknown function [Plasmodium knowlesi strain H]|uniref:Exonuclease 1 n=3 Tax=Plasmodium knowlesi TaxID=5850 RepID=A0A5K1U450_PLAKH|nr:uncharacterized protein PKNH_0802500 [Plasmodium knowlesi strain H]OTN66131.1 Uncharacterized protein PKNOH_S100030300 [Plasmodium knowlesi]CAA9987668.1 MKT1 domain-containing protein, putative [Plasmodium knowlesi strain H]SBO26883.1 conserved Plasmodium protein, unknown function [Plasmodium knowlesi strain H]SBO29654.1 conserved Plasmodium protein, unknown function [Plasmodium knowlesi strain H]VVS77142.1 MKT1 domain-containing protein, putative [Plasmodium knowlesi strain H]|eukprot:XP_002258666.1 [Plasmodium knowlesi strain H]
MRVRRLQSYLTERNLLKRSSVDDIKNLTLGVDALYFLRTCSELKDVLSDVSGCISPCIFHLIDKQCEHFKKLNIDVLFVFDGITPRAHKLFSAPVHQNIEEGWLYYVNKEMKLSTSNFEKVSNICNSDVSFILFHYLKSRGFKCMYAPYLAISQLSYFAHIHMIDIVFGPPTIILQNVSKVIVNIKWKENYFEWVDLYFLLNIWNLTNEQLMDACLLAGTEYCLTFPYLNFSYFNQGRNEFSFETAIEFIRQSSLVSYLEELPNDEVAANHIQGYCVCKALLKFPIVLLCSGEVGFFSKGVEVEGGDELEASLQGERQMDGEGEEHSKWNKVENAPKGDVHNVHYSLDDGKNTQKEDHVATLETTRKVGRVSRGVSPSCGGADGSGDVMSVQNGVNEEHGEIRDNVSTSYKEGDTAPSGGNGEGDKKKVGCFFTRNGHMESSESINPNGGLNFHKAEETSEEDNFMKKKKKSFNGDDEISENYLKVVGAKFPTSVYYLMSIGLLSKKILCVLALGEWIDYTHPIIDSFEYRDSLIDLREYRCRMLGLISVKLNPFFYRRKIKFFDYGYYVNNILDGKDNFTYLDVHLVDGFLWDINKTNVSEEIRRQKISKVDLQFILRWHLYSESRSISLVCGRSGDSRRGSGNSLVSGGVSKRLGSSTEKAAQSSEGYTTDEQDLDGRSELGNGSNGVDAPQVSNASDVESAPEGEDPSEVESRAEQMTKYYNDYYKNLLKVSNQNFESILSLIYYMFLENLGIFTKNCGVTVFGLLLSEVKNKDIDRNILIIFELLKFGFLSTEPLVPPNGDSYPENAYSSLLKCKNLSEQDKKSVTLLSRIYSLYNVEIDKCTTYDGLIDFDLCAFFAVVKIIKKTLRQLLQACVANVLISNMELIHLLPENLYNPDDSNISGFFVTHHLMGVLTKYFLLFNFDDLKSGETNYPDGSGGSTSGGETTTSDRAHGEDAKFERVVDEKEHNEIIMGDVEENNHVSQNGKEDERIVQRDSPLLTQNEKVGRTKHVDEKGLQGLKENLSRTDANIANEGEESNEANTWKGCSTRNNKSKDDHAYEGDSTVEEVCIDEGNGFIGGDIEGEESVSKDHDIMGGGSVRMGRSEGPCKDSYRCEMTNNTERKNGHYCTVQDNSQNHFNKFEKAVRENFPSFVNPIIDLCNAINTWRDHLSLITQLEKHTNVYDLVSDLKAADQFLQKKIHYIGLDKTKAYINICASNNS